MLLFYRVSEMCAPSGDKDEIVWYKKNFPAESLAENEEDTDAAHYKQAMKTMVELNKKEFSVATFGRLVSTLSIPFVS